MPSLSRMTFVVVGDDRVLEQVRKQLEKIVTVVRVLDISSQDFVERDLMLIKIHAPAGNCRTEVRELAEVFRGRIVDISAEQLVVEISGPERKIESFIDLMRPYGIVELVRSGRIAMVRGGPIRNAQAKAARGNSRRWIGHQRFGITCSGQRIFRLAATRRTRSGARFVLQSPRITNNRTGLISDNRQAETIPGTRSMPAKIYYD